MALTTNHPAATASKYNQNAVTDSQIAMESPAGGCSDRMLDCLGLPFQIYSAGTWQAGEGAHAEILMNLEGRQSNLGTACRPEG
jgi:hypothetical protein